MGKLAQAFNFLTSIRCLTVMFICALIFRLADSDWMASIIVKSNLLNRKSNVTSPTSPQTPSPPTLPPALGPTSEPFQNLKIRLVSSRLCALEDQNAVKTNTPPESFIRKYQSRTDCGVFRVSGGVVRVKTLKRKWVAKTWNTFVVEFAHCHANAITSNSEETEEVIPCCGFANDHMNFLLIPKEEGSNHGDEVIFRILRTNDAGEYVVAMFPVQEGEYTLKVKHGVQETTERATAVLGTITVKEVGPRAEKQTPKQTEAAAPIEGGEGTVLDATKMSVFGKSSVKCRPSDFSEPGLWNSVGEYVNTKTLCKISLKDFTPSVLSTCLASRYIVFAGTDGVAMKPFRSLVEKLTRKPLSVNDYDTSGYSTFYVPEEGDTPKKRSVRLTYIPHQKGLYTYCDSVSVRSLYQVTQNCPQNEEATTLSKSLCGIRVPRDADYIVVTPVGANDVSYVTSVDDFTTAMQRIAKAWRTMAPRAMIAFITIPISATIMNPGGPITVLQARRLNNITCTVATAHNIMCLDVFTSKEVENVVVGMTSTFVCRDTVPLQDKGVLHHHGDKIALVALLIVGSYLYESLVRKPRKTDETTQASKQV